MNENDVIPMDGSTVKYEGGTYTLPPEGEYFFTVVDWKKAKTSATSNMPDHINIKFRLSLENSNGQKSTVWDNIRMYKKWLWKLADIAKSIGHTPPDADDIFVDWGKFIGASGRLKLSHRTWEKKDGTKEQVADIKYIVPNSSKDTQKELAF